MAGHDIIIDLGREPEPAAATAGSVQGMRASGSRPPRRRRGFAYLTQELKRRHVNRAMLVYAAVAFVVLQVMEILVSGLPLPGWVFPSVIGLAVAGFPLVVILAWIFDITPAGLRRAEQLAFHGLAPLEQSRRAVEIWQAPPPADRRSIAVLPFVNLTGETEHEHFADGVTEEILARLADLSELRVISRTSVMRYKKTGLPLRAIASELGVANVMEGSVRLSGTQVRITAKLIEAATDTHLWGETYDRELSDIFGVQTDVAVHIAGALEANITERERVRLARRPTANLQAYELYLKARHDIDRGNASALRAGIEQLEQATALDPDFALAHATLAEAQLTLPYWGRAHPSTVYVAAQAAVARALELDPELAEAHTADAALKICCCWNWQGAQQAIERALALTPNSSAPFSWACVLAGLRGRFNEALAHIEEGLKRDPHSPVLRGFKGLHLNYAGRAEESLRVLQELVQHEPEYGVGHLYLALTLRSLRDYKAALPAFRRAHELLENHEIAVSSMAHVLVGLGRHKQAAAILQSLLDRRTNEWVDPFAIASAAFAVGNIELGLELLETAETERSFFLPWIRPSLNLAIMAPLRAHPRMQALLARIGPESQ